MTIYRNPVRGSKTQQRLPCVDSGPDRRGYCSAGDQCELRGPTGTGRSVAALAMLALTLAATACTGEPPAAPPSTVATVQFRLPPGAEVHPPAGAEARLDHDASIEVAPGEHAFEVTWGCQRGVATITAVAGQTHVMDLAASGLASARLVVRATSVDGRELPVHVSLAMVGRIGSAPYGGGVDVPACESRIRIDAAEQPLGAFFEDVEFQAGGTETREIVLAPGPDVVRLRGGSFLLGPTPWLMDLSILESINRSIEIDDEVYVTGLPERIRIEMPTFDLDRTEVTAAQFLACRRAAAAPGPGGLAWCDDDPGCSALTGCYADARHRTFARNDALPFCTMPRYGEGFEPQPHKENRPANCISKHDAALYCKWVGKRLPTDEELEYAARSGDELLTYPWGNARYTTEHGDRAQDSLWTGAPSYSWGELWQKAPYDVCTWTAGNSAQGICDLASNVMEMGNVGHPEWAPRFRMPDREYEPKRFQLGDWTDLEAREDVGFRCARDVSAGADWAPAEPAR